MTDDDFEIDDLSRPPSTVVGARWFVWTCPLCATPMATFEVLPDRDADHLRRLRFPNARRPTDDGAGSSRMMVLRRPVWFLPGPATDEATPPGVTISARRVSFAPRCSKRPSAARCSKAGLRCHVHVRRSPRLKFSFGAACAVVVSPTMRRVGKIWSRSNRLRRAEGMDQS